MTQPIAPSFCSRCGTQVSAGAHFCTVCGSDVSGQQGSLATAQMKPDAARPGGADMYAEQSERLREATLGEYEILGELGRGGMAAVYLAHEVALDRKVAIKVMSPALVSGEGMIERFKREARTAASLSHPHIIPVYAVRESDHLLYFVMKFIAGRPLDGVLKELGPLPIPMIQMILQQVGGAFGYAHRRGIVHRDIKPANIMIDEEGWAVVTDFGIAKVSQAEGLTMTGMTVGTPTYMSPEQCMAQEVTGASDQYSLGVVAYEMITGRPPFTGGSMMAIMYGHFNDPPPPIEAVRPDCPDELRLAVMRMLEKEPARRWPNLEEAVEAIGKPPTKSDDVMRTQLVELAKKSENTKLLKRLSTPISPAPLTRRVAPAGAASASRPGTSAPRTAAPRPAPRPPATVVAGSAAPAQRRTGTLLAGAVAGVLVLGGALALWRPWARPQAPSSPEVQAPAVDSASVPQPSAPVAVTSQPEIPPPAADTAHPATDSAPAAPPAAAPSKPAVDPAVLRRTQAEYRQWQTRLADARRRAVDVGAEVKELGPGDDLRKLADRQFARGDYAEAITSIRSAVQSYGTAENIAHLRTQVAQTGPRMHVQPGTPQPDTEVPMRPQQPATAPAQTQAPAEPPVAAPAPVIVDERPSVELALREYARALAAGDLAAMQAVYPGMARDTRQAWQEFFKAEYSLDTSRWRFLEIQVSGATASAKIGGTSIQRDKKGKASEVAPPRAALLEKGPAGWRITSIN